jgi:hypothetical protein
VLPLTVAGDRGRPGCYSFDMSHSRILAAALFAGLVAACCPVMADDASGIAVALVLDTSASIHPDELTKTRALAVGLLQHLPPGSEIALFTFDDQDRLLLPWTTASGDVERALAIVRPTGHLTMLYDALYDASKKLRDMQASRKALVLLTDGKDEGSALDVDDGLRAAEDAHIPVFTIGVGRVQERVLRRMAKLTGGLYAPIATASSDVLGAAINQVPALIGSGGSGAVVAPAAVSGAPAAPIAANASSSTVRIPSPAPARGNGVWVGLGVGALLLVTLGAVAAMRRRSGPRCPRCGFELTSALAPCTYCSAEANVRIAESAANERAARPAPMYAVASGSRPRPVLVTDSSIMSETVLARLNNTEEFLEKTVTLREKPVLVITAGAGSGRVFSLSEGSATSIGRAKMNDVVLEDISVSSVHCRIRPENGAFIVHDLKTTNGTYVNEKKVAHHPLTAGDTLKIGETSLQFRLDHQRAS